MGLKEYVRPIYKFGRLGFAASVPSRRPIVAVYGNCQAEALRQILELSPDFSRNYYAIPIPGAHEVTRAQLPALHMVVRRASVILTQRIRDDYRALPLGTNQVLTHARSDATILTYPSMFYRGLHPYLAYVHATGELGTPAPLTSGYHDLRFIYAAGRGMSDEAAREWLHEFTGDAGFIEEMASESLQSLRARERNLDLTVSAVIPGLADRSFWTLNHPSNAVLSEAARAAHRVLGTRAAPTAATDEMLTSLVAPVHAHIRVALGYPERAEDKGWSINGRQFSDVEVMSTHLGYYRRRPEVLLHAKKEHAVLLSRAGLGAVGAH
jgi:hypothetical protein